MATIASSEITRGSFGFGARVFRFLADLGQKAYEARFSPEAQRLLALTEEELKAEGLTRDEVVRKALGRHLYL